MRANLGFIFLQPCIQDYHFGLYYTNLRALCLIKMERADKASRELEKFLASAGNEGNVKALYLMGKAKRMMREFLTMIGIVAGFFSNSPILSKRRSL